MFNVPRLLKKGFRLINLIWANFVTTTIVMQSFGKATYSI